MRLSLGEDILAVSKSYRDLKVSVRGGGPSYIFEESQDTIGFVPFASGTNVVTLPASGHAAMVRTRRLSVKAASFFNRAGLSDPLLQSEAADFLDGLDAAGLTSHFLYLSAYDPRYLGKTGLTPPALIGSDATFRGLPRFTTNGILFDGTFSLSIANPLSNPAAGFSIFAAFESAASAVPGLLVGNDNGSSRVGPALWVGGDPYIVSDPELLSFTCSSASGVTGHSDFHFVRAFNWGNRTAPQTALGRFDGTNISVRADIDRTYTTGDTNLYFCSNQGTDWRIGSRIDGAYSFKGTVFLVGILDTSLSDADYLKLRNLYLATFGKHVPFPKIQLVIEGDSHSEEAFGTEYAHWLHAEPHWHGRFTKRNIARAGETTVQMLAEFDSEVPPVGSGPNYLFLWGGANDLGPWSAEEIFNRLNLYWARARSAGYAVAAFTLMPTVSEARLPETREKRLRLNQMIRDASESYQSLFDIEQIPELQDPANLTYFKPDGIHLTASGSQKVADLINRTLQPLP